MNYEILRVSCPIKKKEFYIKGESPSCFCTEDMTLKDAVTVSKMMRQLGHTVKVKY